MLWDYLNFDDQPFLIILGSIILTILITMNIVMVMMVILVTMVKHLLNSKNTVAGGHTLNHPPCCGQAYLEGRW